MVGFGDIIQSPYVGNLFMNCRFYWSSVELGMIIVFYNDPEVTKDVSFGSSLHTVLACHLI
jgi:hypothetical protein